MGPRWLNAPLLLLLGCSEPAPLPVSLDAQLSARHGGRPCSELQLGADGVEGLATYAERTAMPPWAPLRAASCLAELDPDRAARLAHSWVADPARVGLGLAVLRRRDHLAPAEARALEEAALAGPARDLAAGIIGRSPPVTEP